MSGVFLSYSRADRATAEQIATALRSIGVTVWWDEDMRGVDWQRELEKQISSLSCVVVLWTGNSADSQNVRDEARLALNAHKLVNAMYGQDQPPFPFDRVNGLKLDGWSGQGPHRGWTRLIETVEAQIVAAGGARPGEIVGALARREAELVQRQRAEAVAEAALREAQARADEAEADRTAAVAEHATAQSQLESLAAMRGTPAVLRAAQLEIERTDASLRTAEATARQRRIALAQANQSLTNAREALAELASPGAVLGPPRVPVTPAAAPPAPTPAPPPPAAAQPAPAPPPAPTPGSPDIAAFPPPPPPTATPTPAPAPVPPVHAPYAPAGPSSFAPAPTPPRARFQVPPLVLVIGGVTALAVLLFLLWPKGQAAGPVVAGANPAAPATTNPALPTAATPAPAQAAPASPAPAPAPAAADDARVARLVGAWTATGQDCGEGGALRLAAGQGGLLATVGGQTAPQTIVSADANGVTARAGDGEYQYTVYGDVLVVTGPGGAAKKLQRCG